MRILYVLTVILVITLGCKSPKESSKTSQDTSSLNFVIIETSPCEGLCPVYKMTISEDGSALYDGKFDTKVTGIHTYEYSQEIIAPIFQQLNALDFEAFKEEKSGIVDIPETKMTYKSKTIIFKDIRKIPESFSSVIKKLKSLTMQTGFVN